MGTQRTVGVLILIFFGACHSGGDHTKPAPANPDSLHTKPSIAEDTQAITKATIDTVTEPTDTVAHVAFTNIGTQEVKGIVKAEGPTFVCYFTVPGPANLTASILPEKKDCIIRIINMYFPETKWKDPTAAN